MSEAKEGPEKKRKGRPPKNRNQNLRLIKVFCTPAEHGIISSGAVFQNKSLSDFIISLIRDKAFEISRAAMATYEKDFEVQSARKVKDKQRGETKKEG